MATENSRNARSKGAPRIDLDEKATAAIKGALNALFADVFTLYIKTKNFHWHVSGPNFRHYHLLFDEQADQIFNMTDESAIHPFRALQHRWISTIVCDLTYPCTIEVSSCPTLGTAI
jgi:hypothetical protein